MTNGILEFGTIRFQNHIVILQIINLFQLILVLKKNFNWYKSHFWNGLVAPDPLEYIVSTYFLGEDFLLVYVNY